MAGGQRYILLDASRALAAVAVLFWHYQHFFLAPGAELLTEEQRQGLPLHAAFALFYDHGFMAVPIFWMISGFVFSAVYLPTDTSTRAFVVNRFARLYPLHLMTLLVVAVLQLASTYVSGRTLIYENNDAYHFALNLAFASGWGLEKGYSFNGPIWSVSVEILVYALFWLTRRQVFRLGLQGPVALAAAFFALGTIQPDYSLWACGLYFYLGCSLYLGRVAFQSSPRMLAALSLLALPVGVAFLYLDALVPGVALFFGGLLLLLVIAEPLVPKSSASSLAAIGDTTYGLYLWHVPLQLLILLTVGRAFDMAAIADEPWFLAFFLALVLGIARLSFILFERPMRRRLRKWGEAPLAPDARITAP